MKKVFILAAIGLTAWLHQSLLAQDTAAVTWSLLASPAVTATVGAVSGAGETFSFSATDATLNLQINNYGATGGGQRLNLGSQNWPYETVENPGRYVQFAVSPNLGNSLRVLQLSLDLGGGGTSAMSASIAYSLDSTFQTKTYLTTAIALPNSAWLIPSPIHSLDVNVSTGQTFYVRIHPWYASTNASTSKYLYVRNVVVSGVTSVDGTQYPPTVATAALSSISATSATCGGTIVWNGGSPVTERGVCWNTAGSPTTADFRTIDGSGDGSFSSSLQSLSTGSRYYVRAYAANAIGTAYGTERSFVAADPPPPQLAFPGAEGWGKYTVGGRGGAVHEVTNLNDSGPGSLRAAVQASGPRTVVFRVSGTIILNSSLSITNPYITIAGQTAPGDGICLRRYPLVIDADQVIVRYLRVRLGDESGGESDAISARSRKNIIIDHCSASWSQDETLSMYWCDSLTVQWCLITESLYNSNHPKGAHGYGGIWGGSRSTYHHNLLAHHSSRNPRFASGSGNTDFRNNVIYNWGFNSAYGGEAHDTSWDSPRSQINVAANYYKKGPATKSGVLYRIVNPSTRNGLADYGDWYVAVNYVHAYPSATADNWTYGVQGPSAAEKDSIRSDVPFAHISINEETAENAYQSVLANVGANLPKRDSVDLRVLGNVAAGDATYEGPTYRVVQNLPPSTPITGIIDTQSDVGGWPTLNSTEPPLDTDHDGMPDAWESARGLSVSDPSDRNIVGPEGYTNLELYLNGPELIAGVEESHQPTGYELFPVFPNPFNPSTNVSFTVGQDRWASVRVYNLIGQIVGTPFEGMAQANQRYRVQFDASRLPSGVYLAVLESVGIRQCQRMLLMK